MNGKHDQPRRRIMRALSLADVPPGRTIGTPRVRGRVRAATAKGGRAADVFLPDRLVAKLRRFWAFKRKRGESLDPDAPLFCNQSRRRISKRRVQFAWATWQRRAGFDQIYGFHSLRHHAEFRIMPSGWWKPLELRPIAA